MTSIDQKALTRWNSANLSFENYLKYIDKKSKTDRLGLTLIDLLYISNFKGGNSSIHEDEDGVNLKLEKYSELLKKIDQQFNSKSLVDLSENDLNTLIQLVKNMFELTGSSETKIYGFSISFLSALICAHFPNLVPIIDRRVLNGFGMKNLKLNSSQQVTNMKDLYSELIRGIQTLLKEVNGRKSLRELDYELFIKSMIK